MQQSHFILIIIACALSCVIGCAPLRFTVEATGARDDLTESIVMGEDHWFSHKVAMIDVTGLLVDARRPGLIAAGENPVDVFTEALRKAADDRRVQAVILRINSPGGTVTTSDLMYREVLQFKASTGKPVVALMGDVAASGGMYLACAADQIIAYPTTITGSIGVIMQTVNFSEGMRRIGIRAEAITSGPNKALASPFEPMPDEHRQILQNLVNEFYSQFRSVVEMQRPGLRAEHLARITDGRVVSGADAADIGLIDATGDLHDAFAAAKRLANLEQARLVKYHRPLMHVASPYARAPFDHTSEINLISVQLSGDMGFGSGDSSGFYYYWDPGIVW